MTLNKVTKILDKNALAFAKSGNLDKAFAAMECAARIRRMNPKVLRKKIPDNFFEGEN